MNIPSTGINTSVPAIDTLYEWYLWIFKLNFIVKSHFKPII